MRKYSTEEKFMFIEKISVLAGEFSIPAGEIEIKFIDGDVMRFRFGRITEEDMDIIEGRDKKTKSKSDIIANMIIWCSISVIVLNVCYLVFSAH